MEPTLECFSSERAAFTIESGVQKTRAKTKTKKEKSKKNITFYAAFQHGQISLGVHLAEEVDDHVDNDVPQSERDCDYVGNSSDEYDDDDCTYHSNWKKGSKFCRSTSGNSKPKTRPNLTVRAAVIRRASKRGKHIAVNSSAQKNNVEKTLAKKGIRKFGFDIYEKRAEPSTGPKKISHQRVARSHPISHRRKKTQEDHPAALRHELRTDNLPKGCNGDTNLLIELQHRDLTPEDYELLLMLDASVAPKTVSSNVLQSLVVVTVDVAGLVGELCSICMEAYQTTQMTKTLPCAHTFHSDCIDHWLSTASQNCPLDGLAIEAT